MESLTNYECIGAHQWRIPPSYENAGEPPWAGCCPPAAFWFAAQRTSEAAEDRRLATNGRRRKSGLDWLFVTLWCESESGDGLRSVLAPAKLRRHHEHDSYLGRSVDGDHDGARAPRREGGGDTSRDHVTGRCAGWKAVRPGGSLMRTHTECNYFRRFRLYLLPAASSTRVRAPPHKGGRGN